MGAEPQTAGDTGSGPVSVAPSQNADRQHHRYQRETVRIRVEGSGKGPHSWLRLTRATVRPAGRTVAAHRAGADGRVSGGSKISGVELSISWLVVRLSG